MFCLFLKASQGINANWEGDVCKFMQIHLQISTYHQSLGTFPASLCWSRRDWGGTEEDWAGWEAVEVLWSLPAGPRALGRAWLHWGCFPAALSSLLHHQHLLPLSRDTGESWGTGTRQGLTPAVQFGGHHPSSSINFTPWVNRNLLYFGSSKPCSEVSMFLFSHSRFLVL